MKILKIAILFSLSYFCTIYLILLVANRKKLTEPPTKITCLILEFENFQNDLFETTKNLCENIRCPVIIYTETFIYPRVNFSTITNCDITLIELERSIRDEYSRHKDIQRKIETEFVLILPDSIRSSPKTNVQFLISECHNLDALLIPIVDDHRQEFCRPSPNFDVRRWTLVFPNSTIDCLYNNPHVLLVKRDSLFRLSHPLIRPFLNSFLIQSQVVRFEMRQLETMLLFQKKSLFSHEPRLQAKHDLLEKRRTEILFKKLGIKKVQHQDGSVQWYGCDRHQPRCFGSIVDNIPDYLIKDRWLPPCCLRNLEATGRYVIGLLEKSRVRYWLEGGTLLGAARNGQIIPWDYDIDIGMYQEDMEKLAPLQMVHQKEPGFRIQDGQGFVWERAWEGSFIKVHFSETNRIHVDIFPFVAINGTMTKDYWFEDHPQDMPFPEHYLKPMMKIPFIGLNASSPNKVRDFLELKFGPNAITEPRYPGDDRIIIF